MSYEYFAASLPTLRFGAPPPMAVAAFADAARTNLAADDFAALDAALAGRDGPGFAGAWHALDSQLRNAVARARASRRGGDASKWLRPHAGWSAAAEQGVAAAFQEADPLKRHLALERLRWDLAGEAAGLDPFSAAAVCAYGVRLAILEGLATIDADAGLERLQSAAKGRTPAS
jgi:hypothetical protein